MEGLSGFGLGLHDLAATIKASRTDMVAQMDFTGSSFDGNAWHYQRVV